MPKNKEELDKLLAQEYERGFDAGGQTKGGTGRIMYERGLVEGRLQGIADAVAVVEEMPARSTRVDPTEISKEATLTALSSLTHKK